MASPHQQMSFELPPLSGMTREDFIVDEANRLAFEQITAWPQWPADTLVLAGPVGSGKTHLAAIHAQQSGALKFDCAKLPTPEELHEFGDRALIVENGHSANLDETRLFHMMNHVREFGSRLLITTRSWPESWSLELPDLKSRLRAAHPLELNEPGDTLLRQVLVKLFADRQLSVDAKVLDYLLVRMERSLSEASRIVEQLDRLSLERSRPITRQLAAELF
ncbi:MAG: hypothetical protein COA52_10020 [Hyphomicrobiales bacterium]|nr:MAG: hypothetical protein COA52_10020 [Hyphomicrobiales bacterium]